MTETMEVKINKLIIAMRSMVTFALVAVIGFSMTACPEPGGGGGGSTTATYTGTKNGITYTLKITKATDDPGTPPGGNPPAGTGTGTEANPFTLTANTWKDGSITTADSALWYSFNVTSGNTYYVWVNDCWSGDKTKTADVKISAWYNSGGTSIFSEKDFFQSGNDRQWLPPESFIAASSGTVKIKVEVCYDDDDIGTFAIVYSTSSARPSLQVATYTPNITEGARATTAVGDTYELTVAGGGSGTKKSTGEVQAVAGNDLTLKPNVSGAETFTATTQGNNGLTNVTGLITFDDNTSEEGPGAIPPIGGTFTITGIPNQYNGGMATFSGNNMNPNLDSFVTTDSVQIVNGRVSLPMYTGEDPFHLTPYRGNDNIGGSLSIILEDYSITMRIFMDVRFSNGSATKPWSSGYGESGF